MDEGIFPGFVFPAPKGHVQIPNGWYDEMCSQITNLAELKIVMYILRHTVGFQKTEQTRTLTVDEFMHGRIIKGERFDRGTGLSEMSVRSGIKRAIKHGYIICDTDSHDLARIEKSYKLHLLKSEVQELDPETDSGVQELGGEVQSLDLTPQDLDPRGTKVIPRTGRTITTRKTEEKDNKEKHITPPTLQAKKPDIFLDEIIEIVSRQLEDAEHFEENRTEIKRLYAAARASEKPFKQACREALDAAHSMTDDEVYRFNYDSRMKFFLWCLETKFDIRQTV